jgi:hypothetical protein
MGIVVRKTPPPDVPAKSVLPLTAKARISVFVNPVLTAVHDVPLSVERKIPPLVPAKSVLPLTARD